MNMFVRNDYPTPMMRSYGRYSLQKDEPTLINKSDVVNSKYYHPPANYSSTINLIVAIQPPSESPRQNVLLNDKDYLYLQMIE